MKQYLQLSLLFLSLCVISTVRAQPCDSLVPFYSVDLTGVNAGTTWNSPGVQRNGNCCGTVSPDKCIHFTVQTDSSTVALVFHITSGSVPAGALFYQVNCGVPAAVGDTVTLSGAGYHELTFCKPGTLMNTYSITSIVDSSITTEMNEHSLSGKAILFPNPAAGEFTFALELKKDQVAAITVCDLNGKQMSSAVLTDAKSKVMFDCVKWPNGIYYVRSFINGIPVGNKRVVICR